MCNKTACQFLSGFLVGVVLCIWVVSFSQHFYVMTTAASSDEMIGIQTELAEYTVLASLFSGWIKSNVESEQMVERTLKDSKSLYFKNKTISTCIVPLPGDIQKISKLESRIISNWIDTCDNVVFIQTRKTSKTNRSVQKTIKKSLVRKTTVKKSSVSYLFVSGNFSEFGPEAGRFRSHYKAIQFAIMKYPDTNLLIITPTSSDVENDSFVERKTNSTSDISSSVAKSLNTVLTTNSTLNSNAVLSLDKFLLMGKHAVTNLIKMVTSDKCPLDNSRSFQEWASKCRYYNRSEHFM